MYRVRHIHNYVGHFVVNDYNKDMNEDKAMIIAVISILISIIFVGGYLFWQEQQVNEAQNKVFIRE